MSVHISVSWSSYPFEILQSHTSWLYVCLRGKHISSLRGLTMLCQEISQSWHVYCLEICSLFCVVYIYVNKCTTMQDIWAWRCYLFMWHLIDISGGQWYGKKCVWNFCFSDIQIHIHLFSIPEIHQSGFRTCHWITTGTVQNESWQ